MKRIEEIRIIMDRKAERQWKQQKEREGQIWRKQ